MSDRARRAILERRAAFVAAAVAAIGAGAVGGCEDKPRVCLSAAPEEAAVTTSPPDTGVDAPAAPPDTGPIPIPCLSVAMPRDGGTTSTAKPKPKPCLSMLPDP